MKKILSALLLFSSFANAQLKAFLPIKPQATYTIEKMWYLNFDRGDQGVDAPAPWNLTNTNFGQSTNIGKSNMLTSTGAASTVTTNNQTSFPNSVGGIDLNTGGANLGVWPDAVISYVVHIPTGGIYNITGLDPTKFYNLYFHFDTNHYDAARTEYASAGGKSSVPINQSYSGSAVPRNPVGNHGQGLGSGLINTALDWIYAIQPDATGKIAITFTLASGAAGTDITLTSIVFQQTNIAKP